MAGQVCNNGLIVIVMKTLLFFPGLLCLAQLSLAAEDIKTTNALAAPSGQGRLRFDVLPCLPA